VYFGKGERGKGKGERGKGKGERGKCGTRKSGKIEQPPHKKAKWETSQGIAS
jgi:hypothetical protein